MDHYRSRNTGRLILGFILLALGLLWTLDNLDIIESEQFIRWWPVLLIVVGLVHLSGPESSRRVMSGTLFTIAGVVLLLDRAGIIDFNFWTLWPLFLAIVGAMVIIRSLRSANSPTGDPGPERPGDRDESVNTFAFMGGMTRRSLSDSLRGGEITAVMGGAEIDLRGAGSTNGQVVIDVFTFMGGIDITVPQDWTVVCEVSAMLGGFEDKTRPPVGEATTRLVVRGMAVLGGVEVKN